MAKKKTTPPKGMVPPPKGLGTPVPLSTSAPISILARDPGPVPANPLKGITGNNPPGPVATTNPLIEAQFNNEVGGYQTAYDNSIGDFKFNEDSTVNDVFGWKPGAAVRLPDGSVDVAGTEALGVDPSNPFSKMALLSRAYQQQQNRSLNGYAAMGQIHSGAYGRAVVSDQFNNDQSRDSLLKAFEQGIHADTQGRTTAATTRDTGKVTAAGNRVTNYLQG